MKRLLWMVVSTACACALLVRLTWLARALRSGVTVYRIEERCTPLSVPMWKGDQELQPHFVWLGRYIVFDGCPFVEKYIARNADGLVFWGTREAIESSAFFRDEMLKQRTRLANGERPDEFEVLMRLPA